jgi:hypothetical protein
MVRRSRARISRRAQARKRDKLTQELERLAREMPGGAPDRPITVAAAPQVDVIAGQTPCPVCQAALRLVEHAADTVEGVRLRVARVLCPVCGAKRSLYFRIEDALPH